MKRTISITLLVAVCLGFYLKQKDERQLVWSDEFDYAGIPDTSKWTLVTGGNGWGNNELQYYTDNVKNARVQGGQLVISALKEKFENSQFTSARIVSQHKGDWKYGRIEVKAKLPEGRGTWPAIWMLPTKNDDLNWPKDGEIDIMEHVGYNQGMIYGTIHTEKYNHLLGTQKSDSIKIADAATNFHVYSIDWDEQKISWSVDDMTFLTLRKSNEGIAGWPFDKPFHLILNLAVGGNWGGKYGVAKDIWPKAMVIDYVRIYQ